MESETGQLVGDSIEVEIKGKLSWWGEEETVNFWEFSPEKKDENAGLKAEKKMVKAKKMVDMVMVMWMQIFPAPAVK